MSNLTKATERREIKKFESLKDLLAWLRADFCNFIQYSCQKHGFKPTKAHLLMAQDLQAGHRIVQLRVFRLGGKTWLIDNYIVWRWLCDYRTTVLLLGATEAIATKHIEQVDKLLSLMPELSFLRKYSKKTYNALKLDIDQTQAQPNLLCYGIDASFEGNHTTICILDDCEVDSNSDTQGKREWLIKRYTEVNKIVFSAGHLWRGKEEEMPSYLKTVAVYVGTPQTEFSTYFVPEDDEPHPLHGCFVRVVPALIEGRSSAPELASTQQMLLKRQSMTTPEWFLEMMLDPTLLDKSKAVIDIDCLTRYDDKKWKKPAKLIMIVDPKGEGKGKDEAAWCVGGLTPDNRLYVASLVGKKEFNATTFVDACLDECKRLGVRYVYVESNNAAGYPALFEQRSLAKDYKVGVEGFKTTVNKQAKITEALEVYTANEKVLFEPETLKDKETIYQFKTFTFASLPTPDDRLDVLAMLITRYQDALRLPKPYVFDSGGQYGEN